MFNFGGMLKAAIIALVILSIASVWKVNPYVQLPSICQRFRPTVQRKRQRRDDICHWERKELPVNIEEENCSFTRRMNLKESPIQALTKRQQMILTELQASCVLEEMKDVTRFGFDINQTLVKNEENHTVTALIAGDVYSYKTFSRVFDPVLSAILPPIKHKRCPFSFDATKASVQCSLGSDMVKSVHFHVSRSLKEYKFLPACCLDDRREVERALLRSISYLPSRYQGSYFPLKTRCGGVLELLGSGFYGVSSRCKPWPGSLISYNFITDRTTETNNHRNLLCQLEPEHLSSRPDSDLYMQVGINRNWPDARGIYVSNDRNTYFTVNRDHHLGMYHTKQGGDVAKGFKEFCEVYRGINRGLQRSNLHFAYDNKYGFVTWDTRSSGRCLTVAVKISAPHLEKHDKFPALLRHCSLRCRRLEDTEDCLEVSVRSKFGQCAFETMDVMSKGLKRMAEIECRLKRGLTNELDLPSDYSKGGVYKDLKFLFGCDTEQFRII